MNWVIFFLLCFIAGMLTSMSSQMASTAYKVDEIRRLALKENTHG